MPQISFESLEPRRLLSVTVAESEPNTGPADANPVPRVLGESIHFTGAIDTPGDLDWLRIDLQKGDVFGASLRGAPGLDGMIHFGNSAGELLIHNDDSFLNSATTFPPESPMPKYADDIRDPEVFYIVTAQAPITSNSRHTPIRTPARPRRARTISRLSSPAQAWRAKPKERSKSSSSISTGAVFGSTKGTSRRWTR